MSFAAFAVTGTALRSFQARFAFATPCKEDRVLIYGSRRRTDIFTQLQRMPVERHLLICLSTASYAGQSALKHCHAGCNAMQWLGPATLYTLARVMTGR